jgi:hypothetical protein
MTPDRTIPVVTELLQTSVGVFEVDWYVGPTGTAIALDPDAGQADLPEILDVESETDVASALHIVGVPQDEADGIAPGLWARRWRGQKSPGE